MLSIAPVSGADYYIRNGSGCGGGPKGGDGPAAYELDAIATGEPPGEWYYPHRNDLGVEGQIVPDGPSGEAFRTVINELLHPVTGQPLGKAAPNYASVADRVERFKQKNPEATAEQIRDARIKAEQDQRKGRNAWDLTFSVTKSVSVLHAAYQREGRDTEAGHVIAAFRAGIDAALQVVADQMTYTRRGVSGPKVNGRTTTRYVRSQDIQAAIFRHHVSRDRDPQLHAHVMLLNRVQCEDGQWRAVETSELLKSKHMLDAVFQRVMEAELFERLGTHLAARPDGVAREVVGIDEPLRDLFSSRTRALTAKASELIQQWQEANGVPNISDVPPLIKWRLQQVANRETRRAKAKDTPPRAEDIARWDAEMAAEFREGLREALDNVDAADTQPLPDADFDPDAVIALALADLTQRKANWNRSHLMHAISRHLPDMLQVESVRVPVLLAELTDAALEGRQVVSLSAPSVVPVPASLTDPATGESVFEAPTGGRFTTKVHLGREDALIARLEQRGAPVLTEESAAQALSGRGLSAEQFEVAASILTSDRSVEIVNAAAGTGKSRLMAALSDTSRDLWGHGLTGFTTAENAAQVLAREGVSRAHNIAAFLDFRDRERRGEVSETERATFAVPAGATIVVDEASMVSTPHLTELMAELDQLEVGRRVLIGDVAQVDAVDAGGGFALLVREAEKRQQIAGLAAIREPAETGIQVGAPAASRGPAPKVHTLTQVRRFENEWERDASTRLRDGDLTALSAYESRDRIHGGETERMEAEAVQAFVTDHLDGDDTVLVVSTADHGAKLSSRIRQRLVDAGRVEADGVPLLRKTTAGVGDLVQTRMNNRDVGVVNREVWRVTATDAEKGNLDVQRADHAEDGSRVWGPIKTLPASYVSRFVDLAYATTVEAVQGRTTDTAHLLFDDLVGSSRAYPGLTRGRRSNTAWVPIQPPTRRFRESDAEYEARIPSAMSVMVHAFERDDHAEAARTVIENEQTRATHLGHLGPQWASLVAEHRAVDHEHVLRQVTGTDSHALFMDLSLDGLLHLMRSAESHGYDVEKELRAAYTGLRLEGARSPASLLYARFDKHLNRAEVKPRDEVERAPTYAERTPVGDDERTVYAREVAEVMDQRVVELGEQAAVDPPGWATALLGAVPPGPLERVEWATRAGKIAGYREQYGWEKVADPVGPAPSRAEPEKRWAWVRAAEAAGADARQRDMTEASEGELANRVLEWRRTTEWMPRNVDEDLREAHQAHREIRRQVVEARTRGEDTTEDETVRATQAARVARFEKVASARVKAVAHTATTRDLAQEAMAELSRRVDRDRVVAEREAARRAADDRDAREAADREAKVHEAVGERFNAQYVRDAPVFGSQRWAELEDDDTAKRSGLFAAALGWWRSGAPRDEQAITDRLERHGADVAPEHTLTARGLERVRGGEDEEQVRATEPSGELEVLAEVHRFTSRDLEGEAPEFGSPGYAEADDDAKRKAETRGALRQYNAGDPLDEREARAEALDDREAAAAISKEMQEKRHPFDNRTHAEVVKARGQEPAEREPEVKVEPKAEKPEPVRDEPEPNRVDTSWTRDAMEAASREPEPEPKRDDLAEQVQRAKEAVERMKHEEPTREPAPQQREPQVPVREDVER